MLARASSIAALAALAPTAAFATRLAPAAPTPPTQATYVNLQTKTVCLLPAYRAGQAPNFAQQAPDASAPELATFDALARETAQLVAANGGAIAPCSADVVDHVAMNFSPTANQTAAIPLMMAYVAACRRLTYNGFFSNVFTRDGVNGGHIEALPSDRPLDADRGSVLDQIRQKEKARSGSGAVSVLASTIGVACVPANATNSAIDYSTSLIRGVGEYIWYNLPRF